MGCTNNATCDFCDARCAAYIFEFSKDALNFEKDFLAWYDAGKPESNFNEIYGYSHPGIYLIREYEGCEVDRIREADRRWSAWIDIIFNINGRYFMAGYDHGLTEMQPDEFYATDVEEVEPIYKVKIYKDWKILS